MWETNKIIHFGLKVCPSKPVGREQGERAKRRKRREKKEDGKKKIKVCLS